MYLIPNDWKHLFRNETSQKPLFKTFYCNDKGTRKVKDFQKLSYKEIYFICQSKGTKYKKPFKFISWQSFLERHHIFLKYGVKLLLIGLRNALINIYIF